MDGRVLLDLARALAQVKHAGVYRKGTGEPYFNHVSRVAERCHGWRAKVIAYLHDLIEDTDITAEILRFLGFPDDICDATNTLSRRINETYTEFIQRIADCGDSAIIQVKLADLADNSSDLEEHLSPVEAQSKRRRYTAAEVTLYQALEALT